MGERGGLPQIVVDAQNVAGGGGTQAMTVLRARVTAGNPPSAVKGSSKTSTISTRPSR